MNSALKYLYHKLIDSPDRWYPFLAVYYLTYECDFRCPYCSNGFNKPYHRMPKESLPAKDVMDILKRVRRKCDYLVITGGEPLKHPEFDRIMAGMAELKFKDLALNTNGFESDQFMTGIVDSVNTLIFSLDTLDKDKADAWFGGGPGVFRKIMSNIDHAAAYPRRKYRIVISSVATPRNIRDLYDVYDYSQAKGFTFAVCPELRGVKAPAELHENREYREFFDFLVREKKRGKSIHGSPLYLEHMRDFTKFRCRPFTMLVVDPLGRVFYPCLEIGHQAANILKHDDLHSVRKESTKTFGPQPKCGTQCHSACALGFSLILEHPGSMLDEAFATTKGMLNGTRTRTEPSGSR